MWDPGKGATPVGRFNTPLEKARKWEKVKSGGGGGSGTKRESWRGLLVQTGYFQLYCRAPESSLSVSATPSLWDGDGAGSPRCIDSPAPSFGRIRIDETCLRQRFIYLFIWCLPQPHLSGHMGWRGGRLTYRGPSRSKCPGMTANLRARLFVCGGGWRAGSSVTALHKSRRGSKRKRTFVRWGGGGCAFSSEVDLIVSFRLFFRASVCVSLPSRWSIYRVLCSLWQKWY